jgi:type II secretory pathway component PulK
VIWAIGVLSLLFVTYIAASRYRTIEASSRIQRARVEAAAEAGINMAIFDLLSHTREGKPTGKKFRVGGSPTLCAVNGVQLAIAVMDEGGKVDLNTAMPELVEALFQSLRRDKGDATLVARSLLSLRKPLERSSKTVGGGSSGAPLSSIYELDQIAGMDSGLLQELLPIVTVHSHGVGFDPPAAPAGLVRALASKRSDGTRSDDRNSIPLLFSAESTRTFFQISVEGQSSANVRAARESIVEFTLEPPLGYRIREWREGVDRMIDNVPPSARLPAC